MSRRMRYSLLPVLVMISGAVGAAPGARPATKYFQTDAELKRQWMVMNEECRGGQHDPDDAICTARDNIGAELEKRGTCWAYSDWQVFPTEYDWHPCNQPRPKGWRPS